MTSNRAVLRIGLFVLIALAMFGQPVVGAPADHADDRRAGDPIASGAVASEAPAPRPALLMPLYVSLAALQMLDVDSTRRAMRAGGLEGNPVVDGIVGTPLRYTCVKAGTTMFAIWAVDRARKHHPKAAVVAMVALDSALASIVAHNYGIAAAAVQPHR